MNKLQIDLDLAEKVALKFHAGQLYGIHPYMYHLKAVSDSLKGEHDDRLPVIGMLHDIIEDTYCTERVLRTLFDKDIVDAVVALSKRPSEVYELYIERVKANALALKVKMHDSLKNLEESLLRGDMKRVRKYSKQLQLLAE